MSPGGLPTQTPRLSRRLEHGTQEVVRIFFRHIIRKSVYVYARELGMSYHLERRREVGMLAREIECLERVANLGQHYNTDVMLDRVSLSHIKNQLGETLRKIRMVAEGELARGGWVLDAGDSDGCLLKALGVADRAVSVNLLKSCVHAVHQAGCRAVQADLMRLPFDDNLFDVVFCFETVEHLANPIQGLNELARVSAGPVIISVPYVKETRVHPRCADPSSTQPMRHVFEFSPWDFARVLTHTAMRIELYDEVRVFPEIRNPFHRWIIENYYAPSYFPRFQFYVLKKTAVESHRSS